MPSRRTLLISTGVAALGAYSYMRGLRYPPLSWEPRSLSSVFTYGTSKISTSGLILRKNVGLSLRAISMAPSLKAELKRGRTSIEVNNVSPSAKLVVSTKGISSIREEQSGIDRIINIDSGASQEIELKWESGLDEQSKFAVIGDTGGNEELSWCLNRAAELGADFLLHLGDFNYGNDDYAQAIKRFHESPIPVFVSIGNHDFHDSGIIYHDFLQQLGPLNNFFEVAGTRFVNIDTAADYFPANSGQRGKFLETLANDPTHPQVFFTHRPFVDPRPGQDHVIGGINEIPWLKQIIKQTGGGPLLTGHVHHSAEIEFDGIRQYTAGEGLGHEDIVLQRPAAKILMGEATRGKAPTFHWEDLNMPWSAHKSHTHIKKLIKDGDQKKLDWYKSIIL